MAEAKAKKDRVTMSEFRHDENKEKTLKTGHITLYTKLFAVTGSVHLWRGMGLRNGRENI